MGIHARKDCGEDEGLPTVFGCAQSGCRCPTEAVNPNTAGYVLIDELKKIMPQMLYYKCVCFVATCCIITHQFVSIQAIPANSECDSGPLTLCFQPQSIRHERFDCSRHYISLGLWINSAGFILDWNTH